MIAVVRLRLAEWMGMVVLALALALLGFAHHLPSERDLAAQEAYALTGMHVHICGEDGDSDQAKPDCPLCHIASSANLDRATPVAVRADQRVIAKIESSVRSRRIHIVLDLSRPSRGPPVAQMPNAGRAIPV